MTKKSDRADAGSSGKRRKRRESKPGIVNEQAEAYGVQVPGDPTSSERFLSPNDIGKILNITGEAVKQWIYQRRLPAVKLANGYWKVRVSDFEAFLKARHEVGRRRVLLTATKSDGLPEIVEAVEALGHQPICSHNYADALLKSLDHHPALFVLNLSAPEAEPWRLAEKVRSTKALRNVPILLVASGDLSDSDAERAVDLSAQGFLKRPIEKGVLAQELQRILSRTS
jgi:CheY-like chemotaxis protein